MKRIPLLADPSINKIKYRQNITPYVLHYINKRVCLHVDAWFYQMPDDSIYFLIQRRGGGHVLVSSDYFKATPQGLFPVAPVERIRERGMSIAINTKRARKYYPWLAALHKRDIQPYLHDRPHASFKGHISILLHYVWLNPALYGEPLDGIENLYGVTNRAHTAKTGWNARERSQLRTVAKLLQPMPNSTK